MNNAKLSDLRPNPEQPRHVFDVPALLELAQSIRANGVIQPVVVEQNGHGYIIHDGERRWRASCALAVAQHKSSFDDTILYEKITQVINDLAKFLSINEPLLSEKTIPIAITTEVSGSKIDRLVRATVANLQRADLTEVETARAYQAMADTGMTDSDIASACGKSRSTVANARRLLKLPDYLLQAVEGGYCSARTAQAALPALDIKSHEMEFASPKLKSNPDFAKYNDVPTPTALFKRLANPDEYRQPLTSEDVRELIMKIKKAIAPDPCPRCKKNNLKTIPDKDKNYLFDFDIATGKRGWQSHQYCRDCYLEFIAEYSQLTYQRYCAGHKCGNMIPITGSQILLNTRFTCPKCNGQWYPSSLRDDPPCPPYTATAPVGTPTTENNNAVSCDLSAMSKPLGYYNAMASKLTDRITRLIRSVSDPDDMALLERRLDDICTEFREMMAGRS